MSKKVKKTGIKGIQIKEVIKIKVTIKGEAKIDSIMKAISPYNTIF